MKQGLQTTSIQVQSSSQLQKFPHTIFKSIQVLIQSHRQGSQPSL
ncbi:hypothetical protein MIZ03_0954 [Rhodoferax lithotrophicus]|uniref:Uncharacterized protein n=1 Tax=Rhodoferax lithotrophicus TaxID=2798804 RepID=A0ABN6D5J1_9BURK|nr:hypothetical protein MIZ03_0954 [Rhodoferax sp. MIZ03]